MGDNASFQVLNISDILPNRFQPRIKFEDESLDELAESISRFGVIEPIVVRPIGNKYEIIAGERRYKASKLASKTTIPSIVISLSDKDSEELALLENVQRQSLNPIEEAVSYKRILDMGYITREELSKKIGKPQSVILNKTRLLNLADEVQSYLLNNKISERHARALLNITNLDDQVEMLHRIVKERLTVKKTNKEIRNYLKNNKDDDTETLFDNERGNDKMDIDKIMREAQDINAEENVKSEAPDLMASHSENLEQNNTQLLNNISVNGDNAINQEPNKFVSVQPSVNNIPNINVMPVNNVNTEATFDNMFNGSINVQNNLNEEKIPVNQTPNLAQESTVSSPTMNDSVRNETSNSSSSINEEISSIVSGALKNQSNTNQSLDESVNSLNKPLNNIPDFSINNFNNNSVNQTPVNYNDSEIVSQQRVENLNNGFENSAQDSSLLNEKTDNILSSDEDRNLINSSISSPTSQVNASVSDNFQNNELNVVPNFAKIVEKLRTCADEIEKSGHFVNLEEIDLGSQYKVIFTFDK